MTQAPNLEELDALNGTTKPPAGVPLPPPDVAARARQLAGTDALKSAFVHTEDGKTVAKQGDLKAPEPDKPKEDPDEEQDRNNFLAMLLGASAFTKTYDLFGGAIRLTFRTRTAAIDNECARQVRVDELLDGDFGPVGSKAWSERKFGQFLLYQCIASLSVISRRGQPPEILDAMSTKVPATEAPGVGPLRVALQNLRASIPAPLFNQIDQTNQQFELLVYRLTSQANDPGFWKAGTATS